MKRFSEQFNKKAHGIKMRASERKDLRARLVSYMEYHPLPAEMRTQVASAKEYSIASEQFKTVHISSLFVRAVAGVFALFLVVVIPIAAERSVPGDVLYPVKTQFTEELRGTLAFSPYAKVEWETSLLERRIAEARLLASEGRLSPEVEAEVAEAVKVHSGNAKQEIEELRVSDSDEAAIAEIAFASALAVQSEVLEGHIAKEKVGNGTGHSVVALAGVVDAERTTAEATQELAVPSYEKLLARVESESTRAYELFNSIADYASEAEIADIERRLADIDRKVMAAIELHTKNEELQTATITATSVVETNEVTVETDETKSSTTDTEVVESSETEVTSPEAGTEPTVNLNGEVNKLLRTALTDIRKLISFMTDIDVRENVTIEELVPMTLTADERIALIKNSLKEVAAIKIELSKRIVPEFVYEKYAAGEASLEQHVAIATSSLAAGDLVNADTHAKEALMIAADLFAMTSAAPLLEEIDLEEAEEKASTTDAAETEETL